MEAKKSTKLLTVKLESELYHDFKICLLLNDSDMSKTVRRFIKQYIQENKGEN